MKRTVGKPTPLRITVTYVMERIYIQSWVNIYYLLQLYYIYWPMFSLFNFTILYGGGTDVL